MTSKELRAEWDSQVEKELHPKLLQLGFSRRGRGWRKQDSSSDKVGFIDFERKCLKNHLRVKCYVNVWIPSRRRDEFGIANGTLAGDVAPGEWIIPEQKAIEPSIAELQDYIWTQGIPEIDRFLQSGRIEHAGARVGHLDDLDQPSTQ